MSEFGRAALTAVLLAGVAALYAAPASAEGGVGFSFGYDGGYFSDPCDYYDYYREPPPWGLPPDYCEYPVYFEPVYYGGTWYRGPIYYRWYGGERLFWLNGGWHRNEWRGPRPSIRWTDRGGWNRGRGWSGGGGHGGGGWGGGGHNWSGGGWGGDGGNGGGGYGGGHGGGWGGDGGGHGGGGRGGGWGGGSGGHGGGGHGGGWSGGHGGGNNDGGGGHHH